MLRYFILLDNCLEQSRPNKLDRDDLRQTLVADADVASRCALHGYVHLKEGFGDCQRDPCFFSDRGAVQALCGYVHIDSIEII